LRSRRFGLSVSPAGRHFGVVVMGTVWSVIIATDSGVRNVPPIYARAARTIGPKRLHTWLNVILPASLPFIETMLGVRVALADGGGDLRDDIDWLRIW
jgi:ABC-type nitrate/sulfonate/bicarbonate transport system permease component